MTILKEIVNDLRARYDASITYYMFGNTLHMVFLFNRMNVAAKISLEVECIDYNLELKIINELRSQFEAYFLKQFP